jgi:WD40 repeat protein
MSEKAPKGHSKPSQSGLSGRDRSLEKMKKLERELYRLGVILGKMDRKNGRLNMDDVAANMAMDPPTAMLEIGRIPLSEDGLLGKMHRKNSRLNVVNMAVLLTMDPSPAYLERIPLSEMDDLTKEVAKCYKELDKLPNEKIKIAVKYFVNGYASQRPAPRIVRKIKALSSIRTVRFSPDGKLLATGDSWGVIKLWNTNTWRVVRTIETGQNSLGSLAFARDKKYLVTVGAPEPVKLWNYDTGKQIPNEIAPSDQSVLSVAFSPDGKLMAEGEDFGLIRVWDRRSWKLQKVFHHTLYDRGVAAFSPIWDICFSPNGRYMASAGGDGRTRLWNTRDWSELSFGRTARSYSLAFTSDSRLLAVASDYGNVDVWDMQIGQKLPVKITHKEGAFAVAFSPDDRYLATAGSEAIHLWDVSAWPLSRQIAEPELVGSLSFSPKGDVLAVGLDNGFLKVFRLR